MDVWPVAVGQESVKRKTQTTNPAKKQRVSGKECEAIRKKNPHPRIQLIKRAGTLQYQGHRQTPTEFSENNAPSGKKGEEPRLKGKSPQRRHLWTKSANSPESGSPFLYSSGDVKNGGVPGKARGRLAGNDGTKRETPKKESNHG